MSTRPRLTRVIRLVNLKHASWQHSCRKIEVLDCPRPAPSLLGVSCLTEMIRIQNIERKLDDIDQKIDGRFEWLRKRIDEIQAQLNRVEGL